MVASTGQQAIPFLLMRGGTSRGPYFQKKDLPEDRQQLSEVLVRLLGSGHALNIDGIGGGAAVTTKVAILSESADPWADIDYFFAQVGVENRKVDYRPTCGNILTGVGPAALEMGLIEADGEVTQVKIRAVNTEARVIARVQTPSGRVEYSGDTAIDGVPGTAAPIELQFLDVVGGVTGAFLPTGKVLDVIDGVPVSCMDVAMPMVIARAESFGLSGYESCAELDDNGPFMKRMESIRLQAGELMGMGDVTESVTPKFGLLAPAKDGGTICTRYFMPWKCHPSMAVTGSQCLASCLLTPGSVADGMNALTGVSPAKIVLEHGSGQLEVLVDYRIDENGFTLNSAGLVRSARMIAAGELFLPTTIWSGRK